MNTIYLSTSNILSKGLFEDSAAKTIVISTDGLTYRNDSMPKGVWYYLGYEPRTVNSANADEIFEVATFTRDAYALRVCSTGDESLKYYVSYTDNKANLNIVFTEGNGIMMSWDAGQAPWHPLMSSMNEVILPEGMVTIGNYAFQDLTINSTRTYVEIPVSCQTIGEGAFQNSNITQIETSKIRTIGKSAFSGCSAITEVVLSDDIRAVEANTFKDCSALKQVSFGRNVDTVASGAFSGTTNLAAMILVGSASDKIDFQSGSVSPTTTWYRNYKTSDPVVIGGSGDFTKSAIYTKDSSGEVTGVDISKVGTGKVTATLVGNALLVVGNSTNISENLMRDFAVSDAVRSEWTGITSIMCLNVANIGNNMCNGFSNLSTIALGDAQTIGESAFKGCTSLKSMNMPETITTIKLSAFEGCTALTNIDIDYNIEYIGANALYNAPAVISYSGNYIGKMTDTSYTPLINYTVLKNYLLDRSSGYSLKGQMVRDLYDIEPGLIVMDDTKELDLNGKILHSQGRVFDSSGNPVVKDSVTKYTTYYLYSSSQFFDADYSEYTLKFKGGAVISGTNIMGVGTGGFSNKAVDYYMPRAQVELESTEYEFTGSAITPDIIGVSVDGFRLKASDYNVTYEDNTKVGTAKIILTAKSDDELVKVVTFNIIGDAAISVVTTLDDVTASIEGKATYSVPPTVSSDSFVYITALPASGYALEVSATNSYVEAFGTGVYRLFPDGTLDSTGAMAGITVTIAVSTINDGVGNFAVMMLTDSNNGALIELTSADGSGGLMAGTLKLYGVQYRMTDDGLLAYSAISITDTKAVSAGTSKVTWNPTLGKVGSTDSKYYVYYVYAVYEYTVDEDTNKVVSPGMYGHSVTLEA